MRRLKLSLSLVCDSGIDVKGSRKAVDSQEQALRGSLKWEQSSIGTESEVGSVEGRHCRLAPNLTCTALVLGGGYFRHLTARNRHLGQQKLSQPTKRGLSHRCWSFQKSKVSVVRPRSLSEKFCGPNAAMLRCSGCGGSDHQPMTGADSSLGEGLARVR